VDAWRRNYCDGQIDRHAGLDFVQVFVYMPDTSDGTHTEQSAQGDTATAQQICSRPQQQQIRAKNPRHHIILSSHIMGNVVSPAKVPKVTKLKQIVHILVEQQRRIKRSKQEAMRKQKQLHHRMKTSILRKSEKRWADANIDDDIRELAEEISYQRHRILDLKVCVDTLRNLQYKVQSILNAYFTNTTLLVVNNAIKKTNITVEKLDSGQGNANPFWRRVHCVTRPSSLPCSHHCIRAYNHTTGVQDLIDELVKTKHMNATVRQQQQQTLRGVPRPQPLRGLRKQRKTLTMYSAHTDQNSHARPRQCSYSGTGGWREHRPGECRFTEQRCRSQYDHQRV